SLATITTARPGDEQLLGTTRDSSVEENRTTNSDRSNKRKVSGESSTQNMHVTTDSGYSTTSISHPQYNKVDACRGIGMGRLNTSPRATITKTPDKGEGSTTTRKNTTSKSNRTTSINVEVSRYTA